MEKEDGLKHDSSILRNALMSISKSALANYVGSLSPAKIKALNQALHVALDLSE